MTIDGWYGIRLVEAKEVAAESVRQQIATRQIRPDSWCLLARRRMDAPLPDVEICLPLRDDVIRLWQLGDRTVAASIQADLEDELTRFMGQIGSRN